MNVESTWLIWFSLALVSLYDQCSCALGCGIGTYSDPSVARNCPFTEHSDGRIQSESQSGCSEQETVSSMPSRERGIYATYEHVLNHNLSKLDRELRSQALRGDHVDLFYSAPKISV